MCPSDFGLKEAVLYLQHSETPTLPFMYIEVLGTPIREPAPQHTCKEFQGRELRHPVPKPHSSFVVVDPDMDSPSVSSKGSVVFVSSVEASVVSAGSVSDAGSARMPDDMRPLLYFLLRHPKCPENLYFLTDLHPSRTRVLAELMSDQTLSHILAHKNLSFTFADRSGYYPRVFYAPKVSRLEHSFYSQDASLLSQMRGGVPHRSPTYSELFGNFAVLTSPTAEGAAGVSSPHSSVLGKIISEPGNTPSSTRSFVPVSIHTQTGESSPVNLRSRSFGIDTNDVAKNLQNIHLQAQESICIISDALSNCPPHQALSIILTDFKITHSQMRIIAYALRTGRCPVNSSLCFLDCIDSADRPNIWWPIAEVLARHLYPFKFSVKLIHVQHADDILDSIPLVLNNAPVSLPLGILTILNSDENDLLQKKIIKKNVLAVRAWQSVACRVGV